MVEPPLLAQQARVSPINLAEVIGKLCDNGMDGDSAVAVVNALSLQVVGFGADGGVWRDACALLPGARACRWETAPALPQPECQGCSC